MSTTVALPAREIESLAFKALMNAGASTAQAVPLARAIAAAEIEGTGPHGLAYVPTYCAHLRCGKVNRDAHPTVAIENNVVRVDADAGFAHPAIEMGFAQLVPLAKAGIAALAVTNSYNCGVLAYHTEALARHGLVGLGFTNAPASIAPWGGKKPVFGTNPWSLGVPGAPGEAAFVIDQSSSVVAKSEVMKLKREGHALPPGWALDVNGQPTTDPDQALAGSMVPAGGYKGVGSALLVEVFAACLTGATPGFMASAFSGNAGGPPRTGQFFIAINPNTTSSGLFAGNVAAVTDATVAHGGRLPGTRRRAARALHATEPVAVEHGIWKAVYALAMGTE